MKERIRSLRKKLGLKQSDFALKLGVTQTSVSIWESGGTVSNSNIQSICQTFNVRREWLVNGEGEMFNKDNSVEVELRKAKLRYLEKLFGCLDEEDQRLVCEVVGEKCRDLGICGSRDETGAEGKKTQTNNGTIGGDMIQR